MRLTTIASDGVNGASARAAPMVGPRMRWDRRLRHGAALFADSAMSDADDYGRPVSAVWDDAFSAFDLAFRSVSRASISTVWSAGVSRRTRGPVFVGIA